MSPLAAGPTEASFLTSVLQREGAVGEEVGYGVGAEEGGGGGTQCVSLTETGA